MVQLIYRLSAGQKQRHDGDGIDVDLAQLRRPDIGGEIVHDGVEFFPDLVNHDIDIRAVDEFQRRGADVFHAGAGDVLQPVQ